MVAVLSSIAMLMRQASSATLAVTLAVMLLTWQLSAQTLLAAALADLSRYVDAAARFVASAIVGLEKVEAASLSAADRKKAADALREISRDISFLRVSQQVLIEDFSGYVAAVRKRGFASVRDVQDWSNVLSSVRRVSSIVSDTLSVVEASQWLPAGLSAQDRLTLREVLQARSNLLTRFQELPAPSTPEDLDRIEQMNVRYRELFKSLGDLNLALTRAADRLASK
jgi:hypothetical protein